MAETGRTEAQNLDANAARGAPLTNYDVFLNHRGPDVKKGFVDHLATALECVGVRSFVDHKDLHRGEDTWPDIVSAIRHSKIHIAIFTPKYASSSWCLRELCEILECRTNGCSQGFLPVFFKVHPSDLRDLSSSDSGYSAALAKHRTRNDKEDVDKWEESLNDASVVTGWTLESVEGFEARLVKLLVSKVLDELNPKLLDIAKHLVGVDEKRQEALDGMKDSTVQRGLRKFVIYGMGGVGKTTLAKSIYNEIYRRFDGSCFIESVRSEAESPNGLRGVQELILSDLLNRRGIVVRSVSNGKQVMRDRCSGLKILLILDDIDDREQLEALLTPFESCHLKDGSHAVITTRDEQIVKWANAQGQLAMEGLSEAHAHVLFNWHAFLQPEEPPKEFEALATKVVDACQGLPLALETLGAHLYGEGMDTWEATVKALQSGRGDLSRAQREVTNILQISYDGLSKKEKLMFLDVACFMLREHEDRARRVWSESAIAELCFETLRLKSLVKVDKLGRLTMHDLLRDMGHEIVVNRHKNAWQRRYLWDVADVQSVLQRREGASKLRALRMGPASVDPFKQLWWGYREYVKYDMESFAGMDSLEFLSLRGGVDITGDFGLFSKELRWLEWDGCLLESLPQCLDLSKVTILSLEGSSIASLSNGHKFENLRELRLRDCGNFREGLPDFGEVCKRLEMLHLAGCGNLESVPESIGCLSSTLTHLDLTRCEKLAALPDALGGLHSLRCLRLDGCHGLTRLPDAIGQLVHLEEVGLRLLDSLVRLPQSLGNLTKLSSLELSGYFCLEELPSTIGNLTKLSNVCLRDALRIEEIPVTIASLTNLVRLDVSDCTSLVMLPEEVGSLCKLVFLDLSGCKDLREVPPLPSSLEELHTNLCENLREIRLLPDPSLKTWLTGNCPRLMRLPTSLYLESLDAFRCSGLGMPEVYSQLAALTSLRRLDLRGTGVSLGQWIEKLAFLTTIALDGESLPECFIQYKRELKAEEDRRYSIELAVPHTFNGMECKGLVFCSTSLHNITLAIPSIFEWTGNTEDKSLQVRMFRATEHPFVASLKGGTTHSFEFVDDVWELPHKPEITVPEVAVRLIYKDHEFQEVLTDLAHTCDVK